MKNGDKLTLITLNGLALADKDEITLVDGLTAKGEKVLGFKTKRVKQVLAFHPKNDWLIFRGWNIPLKTEIELSPRHWLANASFRLGGVENVEKWVKEKNINELFYEWDRIEDIAKYPIEDTAKHTAP